MSNHLSRRSYLTAPDSGWEGLILVGVGEAGHHLIRSLLEIWDRRHPPFRWIVLIDPDVAEPRNPSFRDFLTSIPGGRISKVLVVAGEIRHRTGWRTFLLPRRPGDWVRAIGDIRRTFGTGAGAVIACPFEEVPEPEERWQSLPESILVVEATDRVIMQRIPGVHLHTGLLPGPPEMPAWQIYVGRTVMDDQPPHPPDFCTMALSEAARAGAEKLARMIRNGKIENASGTNT